MTTYSLPKRTAYKFTAIAMITLSTYCGFANGLAQADEKGPSHDLALRQTITGLTIEGLSLNLTPNQAHEALISTGYQVHRGTEPGHGIYWKNEADTLTKRIRLKSSAERIYQIQLSFAEKNGTQAWQALFNEIKTNLGTATQLCEKATNQELNCLLVSESPTQLSAEITANLDKKANRIKIRLDQRTSKINVKSKMSFGSPQKP